MKNSFKYMVMALLVIAGNLITGTIARAQQPDSLKSSLQQKLEQQQFTFVAKSVTPFRGRQRFLDGSYDVKVSKESVVSYLPFFGVSQSAPLTDAESGIKFTSTRFEYKVEKGKKNKWNVEIKFSDQGSGTSKFTMVVFDNGNASLNVYSPYRDPISFDGFVN